MADIFLSYAREDQARADSLAATLMHEGWEVFWDRNIPVGSNWDEVLEEQLPAAKAITALWSPAGVKSEWVRIEAHIGLTHKKLLPAMIEMAVVPPSFSLTQYADLTSWDGSSTNHGEISKLIAAIKNKAGRPNDSAKTNRPPLTHTGQSTRTIFLGYARDDIAFAEKLAHSLNKRGFSSWWDPQIPVGVSFEDAIVGALASSEAVIVVWSNRGVQSNWVRAEASWALERSKLVGVTMESVSPPLRFRIAPNIDLTEWDGSTSHPAFTQLLQAIGGDIAN